MNSRVVLIGVLSAGVIAAGLGLYLSSAPPDSAPPRVVPAPTRRPPEPRRSSSARAPAAATSAAARPTAPDVPAAAAEPVTADAAPTTGTLSIDSDVAGAEVFLDRTFLGVTPITVPNVTPGSHRLNVTAAGHEGVAETIDVAPGRRDIRIDFTTIGLDARIGVVHKHAFGACEGTLAASPDGLRYDTADGDHAFAAALTQIDTFAVDYLKKTLTLKVKNGRTYNFTDPGGNADRLFVFHRDVEKVRARLSKGQ